MPAPRIAAHFTGHPETAFLEGLPARDLTEDEFEALSDENKLRLAENAASPHAVYRLMPKETKTVAALADQPTADEVPADVGASSPPVVPSAPGEATPAAPPSTSPSRTEGKRS